MRASQSERRILTDAILTEVLIREHSRTNALESRAERQREPDTNRPGETHFATFSADSSNEVVGCIARTFLSVLITRGAMHYLLGPVRTFALYNARPDESCIGIGRYTYHAAAYYMHAESMAHREKKEPDLALLFAAYSRGNCRKREAILTMPIETGSSFCRIRLPCRPTALEIGFPPFDFPVRPGRDLVQTLPPHGILTHLHAGENGRGDINHSPATLVLSCQREFDSHDM